MHRRMSLGVALLLLVVVFAGAGSVSAEPRFEPEKAVAGSFDPLGWVWEWVTSLFAGEGEGEAPGGEGLSSVDGGAFIDPLGNS